MLMHPGLFPSPAPGPAAGGAVFETQGMVDRGKISQYFS